MVLSWSPHIYFALLLLLAKSHQQPALQDIDSQCHITLLQRDAWKRGWSGRTSADVTPSRGYRSLLQKEVHKHAGASASSMEIELKRGTNPTGIMMPLVGLGAAIWPASAMQASIEMFLAHGGKLIDTAISYGQPPVGEALQTVIHNTGLVRDQFWVTSKILPTAVNTSEETVELVDQSLQDLNLTYIDLFLIHWPGHTQKEIWQGLIQARDAGKIKAIGVSNFNPEQITEIEEASGERPSVNQIMYNPWVDDSTHENVRWCQENGIAVQAWGSVGSKYHTGLENAKVQEVASKHGVTPAQVLLRWSLHQGVAVIPGATSEQHIAQNLDVGSFELDADEASPSYFKM